MRGARTRVDIDPSVERVSVVADPDRLVQVIVNLVQNASDAVRERARWSRAHLGAAKSRAATSRSASRTMARASPRRFAQRLFEPFATTKPQGEGTGLGLYTSYMLVQAMHGSLSLENRREGGACATLRLPLGARRARGASSARRGMG